MDDFFDVWWNRIQGIIDSNYSGGYTYRAKDYGSEEKGVIYAGREVEVLDFDDYITITMYLRGVRDEDLEVEPEENSITILFMQDGGWKRRPINLPSIKPETMRKTFKNFILDIRVEKVKK